MEEPENGINPARLEAMVELVRGLAVDPEDAPGALNPLRQVIVNTHSPAFVQLQRPEDILVAVSEQTHASPVGRAAALRLRPIAGSWRCTSSERGVGNAHIASYLNTPKGGQFALTVGAG